MAHIIAFLVAIIYIAFCVNRIWFMVITGSAVGAPLYEIITWTVGVGMLALMGLCVVVLIAKDAIHSFKASSNKGEQNV